MKKMSPFTNESKNSWAEKDWIALYIVCVLTKNNYHVMYIKETETLIYTLCVLAKNNHHVIYIKETETLIFA